VLRQLEYLPVTRGLDVAGQAPTDGNLPRIAGDAPLLQALLQLIETGAEALVVLGDGDAPIGRVTLASLYAGLHSQPESADHTPATAPSSAR
jgi:hypothetical protein